MSAQPSPRRAGPLSLVPDAEARLQVLDPGTGELRPLGDYTQELHDQIAGLQRDVAAEHMRFENLKRDKAAEARGHEFFPKVKALFDVWRRETRHPRASFTADRFWLALPFLENEKYGEAMIRRAIAGAAFDPFSTRRRNGTVKRHDGWELIFRDAGKFEDFANRAPVREKGETNGNGHKG